MGSKIKRYGYLRGELQEVSNGGFVRYEDVEKLQSRLAEAYWLLTTDPTQPLMDFAAEREAQEEYDRRKDAFLAAGEKGEERDDG